jgi:hypothetical protein
MWTLPEETPEVRMPYRISELIAQKVKPQPVEMYNSSPITPSPITSMRAALSRQRTP